MASNSVEGPAWLSRPLRLAAELRGEDEVTLEHLLEDAHVLIRLEEAFCDMPDARETFILTVNQVIRFCQNVAVCVPTGARELVEAASGIAARVHGDGRAVHVVDIR